MKWSTTVFWLGALSLLAAVLIFAPPDIVRDAVGLFFLVVCFLLLILKNGG